MRVGGMDQKQYWDSVAWEKDFTLPADLDMFSRYIDKNGKILDFGCGYGRIAQLLTLNGWKNTIGFDFSREMIERGLSLYPGLNLITGTMESLPIRKGSLDAVILFAVLTSNYRDEDQRLLVEFLSSLLKPGGIIYIGDFLLNSDPRNIERYEKFAALYGIYGVFELPDGAVVRHHETAWVDSLLSGFEKLEMRETVFTTMNGNESRGYFYLGRKP